MTGSLPNPRMHEYAGIDTYYILIEAGHSIPPVLLDVVFEFNSHLAVIVNGCKSVINLT